MSEDEKSPELEEAEMVICGFANALNLLKLDMWMEEEDIELAERMI